MLKIKKWVSTPQKGYINDDSQKPIEISVAISDSELGAIIKKIFETEK